MLANITPVLLTFNEAENIERALSRLGWAKDIVIVDSGSTDETLAIASKFPQVRIFHRAFDTHANQWRFAVETTAIQTTWILRLDADYELSTELISEMEQLREEAPVNGYRISFDYAIYSRKLKSSLYPPNTVLLRVGQFSVTDNGHTEKWLVDGPIENLRGRITHDDRKALSVWFAAQQRYASLEAEHLLGADPAALSRSGRLRRMAWPAPMLVFFYVLLFKGCLLDGWAGWFYALQRLAAETMIALELIDRRLRDMQKKR
ncbi:MAG: glycosyltransferase family 2 protein [Pseudolabrys sp.]